MSSAPVNLSLKNTYEIAGGRVRPRGAGRSWAPVPSSGCDLAQVGRSRQGCVRGTRPCQCQHSWPPPPPPPPASSGPEIGSKPDSGAGHAGHSTGAQGSEALGP